MNLTTPNLFPLPYWAPAFRRVPTPLLRLNEAFTRGDGTRPLPSPARERPGVEVDTDSDGNDDLQTR
jgi:hypothetical protein